MKLASPVKVYWDSCAWLGLANGEQGRKEQLENVYSRARNGYLELWTSTIAIVEANRLQSEMHSQKPIPRTSIGALDNLLFQRFVKLIAVDTDIAKRARLLIRETPKLSKKSDAIHVASAMKWNIATFHTYDGSDLLHLNGKIICDDGIAMTICEPSDPTTPLFGGELPPASTNSEER